MRRGPGPRTASGTTAPQTRPARPGARLRRGIGAGLLGLRGDPGLLLLPLRLLTRLGRQIHPALGLDVGDDTGVSDRRQDVAPHLRDLLAQIGPPGVGLRDQLDTGERGDDDFGRHHRVDLREHLAALLPQLQHPGRRVDPVAPRMRSAEEDALDGEPGAGPGHGVVAQRESELLATVHQGLERRPLLLELDRGGLLVHDRLRDGLLGGEVEVQGPLGDLGPTENLRDGGTLVAVVVEDARRGIHDRPPRLDRASLLRHFLPPGRSVRSALHRRAAVDPTSAASVCKCAVAPAIGLSGNRAHIRCPYPARPPKTRGNSIGKHGTTKNPRSGSLRSGGSPDSTSAAASTCRCARGGI